MNLRNVLITGAAGHVGHKLMHYFSQNKEKLGLDKIIGIDIREHKEGAPKDTTFEVMDIRSEKVDQMIEKNTIHTVIHLASIVTPPKGMTEQTMYSIDVEGSQNILNSSIKHGVKKLAVSSSGAAYGYYPDNPEWLTEKDAIRGNDSFAYSRHKRLVEEMLEKARKENPQLGIFVFRICTVLGKTISNQITDLFKKPALLGLRGCDTPWVFIWDEDVVHCFASVLDSERPGNYNLAGDGKMTIDDLAKVLHKPVVRLPANAVKAALKVLKRFNLTQYGDEQVQFIQYRPVLLNSKLKTEYQYRPQKSSKETFDFFVENNLKL